METAKCVFTLPEGGAEKYRITYNGQDTYAFIMSNRYIMGLFARCEAAGKSDVSNEVRYRHPAKQAQKTVLFQALLLDEAEYGNNELSAGFHTIYCLNKK